MSREIKKIRKSGLESAGLSERQRLTAKFLLFSDEDGGCERGVEEGRLHGGETSQRSFCSLLSVWWQITSAGNRMSHSAVVLEEVNNASYLKT